MEHTFRRCESCDFCIEENGLPKCLIKNENTGLLLCCEKYKERTGEHISF